MYDLLLNNLKIKFCNIYYQITNDYVRNSSLLVSLAKAIGRVIISYKDISELAGYTHIVTQLDKTIDDLDDGYFMVCNLGGKRGKEVFLGKDYFCDILKMINGGFEDKITLF